MKILLSSEVAEEVSEILQLLPCDSDIMISIPDNIAQPDLTGFSNVTVVISKQVAAGSKFQKMRGLVTFLSQARSFDPDVLISGFPLLKHRVLSQFSKIDHIAYIRGLMFDSAVRGGFSDQLEASIISRILPRKVGKSLHADHFLTTSEVNRKYLEDRGFGTDKITLCGPVWLTDYARQVKQRNDIERIIICTSALAAHGHVEHHEQMLVEFASAIELLRHDYALALRIHPRDQHDYQRDVRFANIPILEGSAREFLDVATNTDVLLSHPSTLLYEAGYLGVRSLVLFGESVLQSPRSLEAAGLATVELSQLPTEVLARASAPDAFSEINLTCLTRILDRIKIP